VGLAQRSFETAVSSAFAETRECTSPMPYTNTNTGSHMPNYSPVERNIINKLKEDNSKLLANVRTLEEENEKLKAELEDLPDRSALVKTWASIYLQFFEDQGRLVESLIANKYKFKDEIAKLKAEIDELEDEVLDLKSQALESGE
jgi:predicted RNase H-like nuclease (RuvC/YqgF family)